MPRRPIIRTNEHYYHVVARCNNKDPFDLPMEEMWQLTINKLCSLQRRFKIKIGAFVLMHNHFHLLVLTPEEDIDRVMYFFMRELTLILHARTGRINRIFGGRYKGCVIENVRYLFNVYKYIYRNPVAAGISERAELYPYSTLCYKIKNMKIHIELTDPCELGSCELEWINQSFQDNERESIKYGLSRTTFQYKQSRSSRCFIEPNLPGHQDYQKYAGSFGSGPSELSE